LFACTNGVAGPAVWASWFNGTAGSSREFYVRRLGLRAFDLGPEIRLDGSALLSGASVMCASGSSTQNPAVIWANSLQKKISWRTIVEPTTVYGGKTADSAVSTVSLEERATKFLSQNQEGTKKGTLATGADGGNQTAVRPAPPIHGRRTSTAKVVASMQLRGEGDVLAFASNDEHGGLTVRIFDMAPIAAYPTHQVTLAGAKLERITYDVTLDQALILCFSHHSGITCERRHLQALMEPEMEQISWWFAMVILFVLFWFRHECFNDASQRSSLQWSSASSRSTSLRMSSMARRFPVDAGLPDNLGNIPRSMWRFNALKSSLAKGSLNTRF